MASQGREKVTTANQVLEPKKVILAILLGLMGWGGAFLAINLSVPQLTLSFIWSYCFPLLASMAYGAPYGLIAGLLGLGALFPFFIWPTNGWANVITTGLLLVWYAGQGACAQARARKPAFWNHVFFAQLLFTILYVTVMLFGFPAAVAANPPFWAPAAITVLPAQAVVSIVAKGVLNTFLVVPVVLSLLVLPPVRRWLALPARPYSKKTPPIIGISVLTAIGLWFILIVLNAIFGAPGFHELVLLTGSQQETVSLIALVSMGCLAGYIVARYVEKTQQAENALQESETYFRSLINRDLTARKQTEVEMRKMSRVIEQSPACIVITDLDGAIEYVNPKFAQLTGYTFEEVVGKNPSILRSVKTPAEIYPVLWATIQSGKEWQGEFCNKKKNGELYWESASISPVLDAGGSITHYVGVKIDITERKQRESELEALAAVSSSLRTRETLVEMLPVVLDNMINLLGADSASIELIDPSSGNSVVTLTHGDASLPVGHQIPADQGLNSYIRASGRPYLNNDVHSDPRMLEECSANDSTAVAGVPMIAQGQLLGFLWIGRKSDILEGEMRALVAIADIAANAIRRTNLHEQTTQRLKQLSALRAIDAAINENRDLQGTLKVLLEQSLNQLRVDAAMILRLDETTQSLVIESGLGFQPASLRAVQVSMHESLASKAIQGRKVLQVADLRAADAPQRLLEMATAEGFVAYYAAPLVKEGLVKGVIEVYLRKPLAPDHDWLNFLEMLAGQAAIAIDNVDLFQRMVQSNLRLANAYDATIAGWSAAMDLRDRETEGHTRRVTELTLELAQVVGIPASEQIHIRRGAMLHDIGKIGVPDSILHKKGRLTEEEWAVMRKHPQSAYNMLSPIDYLRPALAIPLCHHERWDGTGYPNGLKGDQIPLAARVFALVDVWDALISNRPYRPAWSRAKALEYIREQSGKQFDPQIVASFLEMLRFSPM